MPDILIAWFEAFLLTLVVEIPLFCLVARGKVSLKRAALAGAAGTCLTHPLLWFVWPFEAFDSYALCLTLGEILVAAVETWTFHGLARPITWARALFASLLANGASTLAGLFYYGIL